MPQNMVDLPFEKIVATVKKMSEEEQEKLLFAINSEPTHYHKLIFNSLELKSPNRTSIQTN